MDKRQTFYRNGTMNGQQAYKTISKSFLGEIQIIIKRRYNFTSKKGKKLINLIMPSVGKDMGQWNFYSLLA